MQNHRNMALKIKTTGFFILLHLAFLNTWAQDIAMTNNQEQYRLFEASIVKAEEFLKAKDYKNAKIEYKNALKIRPEAIYPKDKIEQINKLFDDPEDEKAFNQAIENGNNYLSANDPNKAKTEFEKALSLKPDDKYSRSKIRELKVIIANRQNIKELFDKAISEADNLYKNGDLIPALQKYHHADSLLPNQEYPQTQISAIEKIYADKKAIQDKYDNAITEADNFYIAKNFEKAKSQYLLASKLKPGDRYPINMIEQINSKVNSTETETETEASPTPTSDIVAQKTEEIKPASKDSVAQTPTLLADNTVTKTETKTEVKSENKTEDNTERNPEVNELLQTQKQKTSNKLDNLKSAFETSKDLLKKDIKNAQKKLKETPLADNKTAVKKDSLTKKEEVKSPEVKKTAKGKATQTLDTLASKPAVNPVKELKKEPVIEKPSLTPEQIQNQENYKKSIAEGDRLLASKSYDMALESYKNALHLLPNESYPNEKINEIIGLFTAHIATTLNEATTKITANTEKKFNFPVADLKNKKNNYLLLKAKVLGNKSPKIFVNYGKDAQKNGGIVLKNITDTNLSFYLIRISSQDLWIRLDNSWIGLYPAGGDIEIETMQICNPE